MRSPRRPTVVVALLLLTLGLLAAACGATRAPDQVHVLTWHGDVNPIMQRYVERGIDTAERSNARAVVLRLDTPGGLDSAMRAIIQHMEASTVPVLVYVSPSGGRAASAGTFITMAGQVAAMAPGTTIGAASPVSASGGDISGTEGKKVTNDAVAYIRSIAQLRGRNADWAEQAVRDAVAVNQDDAVQLHVVDFTATSLDDLLKQADGRQVQVAAKGGGLTQVTLHTAGASVTKNNETWFEELLYRLADPDLAFLLLTLGGLALLSELLHPTFFAGIFGVIALVFAYFALGSLETNWAGVALVLFGLVLLGLDVAVTRHGVLAFGGVAAISLGGLILFSGSTAGEEVSRWLVFGTAAVAGGFVLVVVSTLIQFRRRSRGPARERLLGASGVAKERLDPRGSVLVRGERWDATAEEPPIESETAVVVTAVEGLHLRVRPEAPQPAEAPVEVAPQPVAGASPGPTV